MKAPQWIVDAWDNVSQVSLAAWRAMPQGARDFLKGVAFGVIACGALAAVLLWGRP